jgi:hypothetical protein
VSAVCSLQTAVFVLLFSGGRVGHPHPHEPSGIQAMNGHIATHTQQPASGPCNGYEISLLAGAVSSAPVNAVWDLHHWCKQGPADMPRHAPG